MCFSVQVDKNIKKLAQRFRADIAANEFIQLNNMRQYASKLETDKLKLAMGLKRKPSSELFKTPDDDGRIYPGYFAPVIVWEQGKRLIRPMRYRVRPHDSKEEIPTKYNVFNARIDSLEKRQTWKPLFMKHHGLFPFIKFYEWVEDEKGKKKLINFSPDQYELMWAPCLWDYWQSKEDEQLHFYSFALLTDDPPPEIQAKGHDRCPIFLKEELIDQWLSPEKKNKAEIYHLLKQTQPVHFSYQWIA